MTPPTERRAANRGGAQQLRLVYETARALAESSTLAEAAPRMLESICRALSWEHGALWTVDKAAAVLRCVAAIAGVLEPQYDERSAPETEEVTAA